MYTKHFDQERQIFHATLSDDVALNEIAQSLRDCFTTQFTGEIRGLWNISTMQVAFGLADVDQLVQVLQSGHVPSGKMAFVIGDQQFLKGVVESVHTMREMWSTSWRTFATVEDATTWLCS